MNKPDSFLRVLLALPWILREPLGPHKPMPLPRVTGLGDAFHNWCERRGIGPKVRAYYARLKKNCGCEQRRQWLNRIWPFAPKRGEVFLTIGMPHFNDWEGAWSTIQSVLYEADAAGISDKVEILVVDQSPPGSTHSEKLSGYLRGWVPRSQYVPMENLGTAMGKSAVFSKARGEWVLLLDCHAALKPGSLGKMFQFMAKHRHDGNLYSGVMDLGAGYQWQRSTIAKLGEWMIRQSQPQLSQIPDKFKHLPESAIVYVAEKVREWQSLVPRPSSLAAFVLGTDHGYHSHVDRVWRGDSLGRWATDVRAARDDAEPFEVDNMAGWFLFCRRDAWLRTTPYHPLMRGFGGEEGVMTLAFNRAGRKTFVAPFARGTHRFGRADPIRFPLTINDRIRNYALAFHSMSDRDEMDRMRSYFTSDREDRAPMSEAEFDTLVAGAIADHEAFVAEQKTKRRPPSKTLSERFEELKNTPGDLNEHLERLRELASECSTVTEFGTANFQSGAALLMGRPKRLVTVDINGCSSCLLGAIEHWTENETDFVTVTADTRTMPPIEPTDLLFIDTWHTSQQIRSELDRHADRVAKYIVLHDTTTYWEVGSDGTPGLRYGLEPWLAEHSEWAVIERRDNNHGLLVMRRQREAA